MPTILDAPPQTVQRELDALVMALSAGVPSKDGDNVLIATWNFRSFGNLTRKWTATADDSPKRDLRGLRAIIEILSRFDVIALQEVKGNLRALRDMLNFLGDSWGLLLTDVTLGDAGNDERMAFLFDRDRVTPSGLACELVVPPEQIANPEAVLREQFVRTPYAASFRAGAATFILVTAHINFGSGITERRPEVEGLARWLRLWADREHRWEHNLILLGDLNIERRGNALWQALQDRGLRVPDDLTQVPRTIFARDAADVTVGSYRDQIAWFADANDRAQLTMDHVRSGSFDFVPLLYQGLNLTRASLSFRISDHYPLWSEFRI